jgi:hypothetical protein
MVLSTQRHVVERPTLLQLYAAANCLKSEGWIRDNKRAIYMTKSDRNYWRLSMRRKRPGARAEFVPTAPVEVFSPSYELVQAA